MRELCPLEGMPRFPCFALVVLSGVSSCASKGLYRMIQDELRSLQVAACTVGGHCLDETAGTRV